MSKIGLIIKREYLRRVSKKSFILLTFLTPFLFAALAFVPLWLSSIKGDEVHTVAILDATGKYAPLFEDTESYRFINGDKDMDKYRQMSEKEIFAFLNISDDLQKNPKNATLYSKKQIPADLSRLVNMTLKKQIESDKLATFNIPNLQEIIKESKVDFNIQRSNWGMTEAKSNPRRSGIHNRSNFHHAYLYVHPNLWRNGHARGYGRKDEPDHRDYDLVRQTFRLNDG